MQNFVNFNNSVLRYKTEKNAITQLLICKNVRITIPTFISLILLHLLNFVKFHPFILKILSGNEILTQIKGHESFIN